MIQLSSGPLYFAFQWASTCGRLLLIGVTAICLAVLVISVLINAEPQPDTPYSSYSSSHTPRTGGQVSPESSSSKPLSIRESSPPPYKVVEPTYKPDLVRSQTLPVSSSTSDLGKPKKVEDLTRSRTLPDPPRTSDLSKIQTPPARYTTKKSGGSFWTSFKTGNYQTYVLSLSDHDLERKAISKMGSLGGQYTSFGVHITHTLASGFATAPIAVVSMAVSSRKVYLNSSKLAIIEKELKRRGLDPKPKTRDIAKFGGKALVDGVTMGALG